MSQFSNFGLYLVRGGHQNGPKIAVFSPKVDVKSKKDCVSSSFFGGQNLALYSKTRVCSNLALLSSPESRIAPSL